MSEPKPVTSEKRQRATILVAGRVQGVGFRAFARRQALDLGLAGHAENLADGRVEIVAEGPRDQLEHYLVKLRVGPTHARVDELEVQWAAGGDLAGFYIY